MVNVNAGTKGRVWVVLVVILAVLFIFAVSMFSWFRSGYDKAVRLEEQTEKAWGNVDAALQRRLDLVPNLVETVRGYADREKELFENLAKSRERYFQANSRAEKMQASNMLSGLLSRLLVLREAYPQLKANENFLTLQSQLEGAENRIGVARTRYNEAVERLNSFARSFFGRLFCSWAGVQKREYFEADREARTVPEVDFGTTGGEQQVPQEQQSQSKPE